MTDPIKLLEAHARKLYRAWRLTPRHSTPPTWTKLPNHTRELWREKALLAIRGKETLADELKREDRERSKMSEQRSANPAAVPGSPQSGGRV